MLSKYNLKTSIVSIIGEKKSGKSLILNKLLDIPSTKGFESQNNEGFLMWSIPYYIKSENRLVYFVECQELNKKEGDDILFWLLFAISSIIILTVNGEALNDRSLNSLSALENINGFIDNIKKISPPKLIWAFMDVSEKTLKQIAEGSPAFPGQILEAKLQELAKKSNEINKKKIQNIGEVFLERKALYLPKAFDGNNLRKEFLKSMERVKPLIYDEISAKFLFENFLNSRMMLTFINSALESFSDKNLIDLSFWYF